ncbi:hypothetical protein [Pseudomonas sp. TE50-2]|uniref:hypothetical protein n=1 Tax=Pseudomonas sp. TE50-2 TaxID=3142707 RepID=UPI0034664287
MSGLKDFDVCALLDDGYDEVPELLPVDRQADTLEVSVPAWSGILPYDTIALTWGTERLDATPGAFHDVTEEEAERPDQRFLLYLPASSWGSVDDGEEARFSLGYDVKPEFSDQWEQGPRRWVRIDKQAPGGAPGALGRLVFPEALEERGHILESDFTEGVLQVEVSGYDGKQLGDRIEVTVTDGVVTASAGQTTVASASESTPVDLHLDALQKLFEGVRITFTYQVTDRAGNVSEVSLPHNTLKLQLTPFLDPPRVEDVNDDNELDFNALDGGVVGVVIDPDDSWQAGIVLFLLWTGMAANGDELLPVVKRHDLEPIDLEKGVRFELENVHAAAVLQGSATLVYRLASTPWRHSKPVTISVLGTLELEGPSLDGVDGSWLDPEALPEEGVTVRIAAYEHMALGDRVLLKWKGTTGGGDPSDYEWTIEVTALADVEHLVDKGHVLALRGGTLELSYTVTSVGGAASPSPSRDWRIPNLLRRPEVEKAFGDDLDQLDFQRDFIDATHVKVTVATYLDMTGDEVAVLWVGTFTYQSPWLPVSAPGDLVFEVPRAVLMDSIGKTVFISYIVKREEEETSDVLELTVLPQQLEMQAPVYMSFGGEEPKFSLRYDGIEAGDVVEIYWQVDQGELREDSQTVYPDGQYRLVLLDQGWIKDDKGKTVYTNYSIMGEKGQRQFSPVLRFEPGAYRQRSFGGVIRGVYGQFLHKISSFLSRL